MLRSFSRGRDAFCQRVGLAPAAVKNGRFFGGIGGNLVRIQDHSLANRRVIRGLQQLDLEKKGVCSSYTPYIRHPYKR